MNIDDPFITCWNANGDEALLNLLRSGDLPPHRLTYAAEAAANIADSVAARAALVPLLRHVSALVREGAILGLGYHLDDATRSLLRDVASRDPSPAVRMVALGAAESE